MKIAESEWKVDSDRWRRGLSDDGYLVVENVLTLPELEQMRSVLDTIERQVDEETLSPSLRAHVGLEKDRTAWLSGQKSRSKAISVIMELPLFNPIFAKLIAQPRVLDLLEVAFGTTEFSFHNYKAICKMPGNEAPFQWHRDLPYLEHTSANLITCMLCVDPMTAENGATVVCPGTHRLPDDYVRPEDTDIPEEQVPDNRVTVICPAGSAVLFHVNIIHGGGPNRSQDRRRNVIGIWAGPDCYPTTPARYAYHSLMPRSQDPMRQRQVERAFGRL